MKLASHDDERDAKRDGERDAKRDAQRDEERDAERDEERDVERDEERDVERDEERDVERDEERDVERDEERDEERDAWRDEERARERTLAGGHDGNPEWADACLRIQDELPLQVRETTDDEPGDDPESRDVHRDAARDFHRDAVRDSEGEAERGTQRDGFRGSDRTPLRDAEAERRQYEFSPEARPSSGHDDVPLVVAIAAECIDLIGSLDRPTFRQPPSLQLRHLKWMCDQVAVQSELWPTTQLHRWIGFIQAGLIANRLQRLDNVKRMFEVSPETHPSLDQDLIDHLDPDCLFELDIGGEG